MELPRLAGLRIEAGKTQEDIAAVLSCSREVYRRYERGVYDLPLWALNILANYYHTTTDYILGISDIRRPL